jgi:amidase
MTEGVWESAGEIAAAVRSGRRQARSFAEQALQRSRQVDARLNCFAEIAPDYALAAAARVDDQVAAGQDPGPLAGVPIAIKDSTPVAGLGWRSGSWAYADRVATRDAVVVKRLLEAGAIVVGKTTLPEVAYSSFCDSPLTGVTRNPWDPERTPGGSSGGSAVAVATGCVTLAEGTDMGGSVRIPAAFTGLLGIKPSAGRIPNDDMDSVVDDIAHHGLLTRSSDDLSSGLSVVYGPDPSDPRSLGLPGVTLGEVEDVSRLRVAVSADLGFFVVEPFVAERMASVAEVVAREVATVTSGHPAWNRDMADAWVRHWHAYLAAYFGDDLDAVRDRVDPRLQAVLDKGRALTAVQLKKDERLRTAEWLAMAEFWKEHDVLLCPTMSRGAVPVGGDDAAYHRATDDGRKFGLDLTSIFNWVPWCPVISVPVGTCPDGLPLGVQVVAPPFRDDLALAVARVIEREYGVPRPQEA